MDAPAARTSVGRNAFYFVRVNLASSLVFLLDVLSAQSGSHPGWRDAPFCVKDRRHSQADTSSKSLVKTPACLSAAT